MDKGLMHLYWGDGKGKTTAAMGLAVRALGQGFKVTVVQFLKSGTSGELESLRTLGATVYSGKMGNHFFSKMSPEEQSENRKLYLSFLNKIMESTSDLLIMDEACGAWEYDLVDRDLLRRVVECRPAGQEMVLTGRHPADWMIDQADYITEMRCHRHPYEQGIVARKGVEF